MIYVIVLIISVICALLILVPTLVGLKRGTIKAESTSDKIGVVKATGPWLDTVLGQYGCSQADFKSIKFYGADEYDDAIKALRITGSGFRALSHRDYLGALLVPWQYVRRNKGDVKNSRRARPRRRESPVPEPYRRG